MPIRPWFELKLQTDIPAFVGELERFTKDYADQQSEERLIGAHVGEWRTGFWNPQPIDRTGQPSQPSEARSLSVQLDHQSEVKEWMTVPTHISLSIARHGDDHILLTIPPGDTAGYPFACALVARCRALWEHKVITGPRNAPMSARQVIDIFYRRKAHDRKVSLKQICDELGVNYASIRAAKTRYDRRKREEQR